MFPEIPPRERSHGGGSGVAEERGTEGFFVIPSDTKRVKRGVHTILAARVIDPRVSDHRFSRIALRVGTTAATAAAVAAPLCQPERNYAN